MSIGENIRDLRIKNKLTQPQLAKKIGSSNGTISEWENNKYIPKIDVLRKIAGVFKVSISRLDPNIENSTMTDEVLKEREEEKTLSELAEKFLALPLSDKGKVITLVCELYDKARSNDK